MGNFIYKRSARVINTLMETQSYILIINTMEHLALEEFKFDKSNVDKVNKNFKELSFFGLSKQLLLQMMFIKTVLVLIVDMMLHLSRV